MAVTDGKGRMIIRFYATDPKLQDWYENLPMRTRSLRLNEVIRRGLGVADEELVRVADTITEFNERLSEVEAMSTYIVNTNNLLIEKVNSDAATIVDQEAHITALHNYALSLAERLQAIESLLEQPTEEHKITDDTTDTEGTYSLSDRDGSASYPSHESPGNIDC